MSASTAIRNLQSSDIPTLVAGFAAMGWSKPAAQFERYLDEHRAGTRLAWVAEVGETPVGYVTLIWPAPSESASPPVISDLNVLSDHRRLGIGSLLMDHAERAAATRSGVVAIAVGLHPGYRAAQRMYVLRGYVPYGRGVTYRGTPVEEGAHARFDDDLVLHMQKELRPPPS